MTLVDLVLVFCLAGAPNACREERPLLMPVSRGQCFVEGQQIAAEWLGEHPKWTLARWRCEDAEKPKEEPS